MKQLIVNADDYNTDAGRNQGILEAARRGIVTSVSVLANAGWPEGSLDAMKTTFGPRAGVHLNLTKGRPVCHELKSLVSSDGFFYPKAEAWRRAWNKKFDPGEAEREFDAQIEALLNLGIVLDHVDGNNHLHVFSGMAEAAARAAARSGIRRVRLPREPLLWSARQPGPAVIKKCFFYLLSLRARTVFRKAGLISPDRCAGIHVPDIRNAAALVKFLACLPDGTTELVCHPGYRSDENIFSGIDRERELAALTAPVVADAVRNNTIRLSSFSDIPCA